jgi:molybdate transport system ATP-binding protein
MSRSHRKTDEGSADREFLAFENVSIRLGEVAVFQNTNWTWRFGEQWAMLGPDGSGKALLVEAILGRAPIVQGEVRGPFPKRGMEDRLRAPAIAHVSPQTQRELAVQESSFYQLRWHSGLEQGPRTVAEFLSHDSVEDCNPFEVDPRRGSRREFLRLRRQFVDWLGIKALWRRRLIHLSNGEMRKTLLTHALLKSPRLLILDDPYAGLDAATRRKLGVVISRLMRVGWAVLVATHRAEEIPEASTHLLLIDNHHVIAQGPKQLMIALWRKRFGAGPPRSSRLAERNQTEPGIRKRTFIGEPLVELCHATVAGAGRCILQDVTWTLREGECWALLGPNGAGKTTLLNLIQGDHPQAYSLDLRLFGHRTDSTQAVWRSRQKIGWMSPELHQHYPAAWESLEVVCSGYFNTVGLYQMCSRRQLAIARQWLEDLGLARQVDTPFGELSFGQQRLVLLARAGVKSARLLILDEPCQGLDAAQRRTVLAVVDRVMSQTGASLIFVSHHEEELPRCITHVLRLAAGSIREAKPRSQGRFSQDCTPGRTLTCNHNVRSAG